MKKIFCAYRFGFDFCRFYGVPVHFGACKVCKFRVNNISDNYSEFDFDTDLFDVPF